MRARSNLLAHARSNLLAHASVGHCFSHILKAHNASRRIVDRLRYTRTTIVRRTTVTDAWRPFDVRATWAVKIKRGDALETPIRRRARRGTARQTGQDRP